MKDLFSEFYRVLSPGSGVRIIVPSLEYAVNAYNEERVSDLLDWPEKYDSIGGRFNNFMLCANQHFLMFDFSFLNELLAKCGFIEITREKARTSRYFEKEHMQFEPEEGPGDSSLYVECRK